MNTDFTWVLPDGTTEPGVVKSREEYNNRVENGWKLQNKHGEPVSYNNFLDQNREGWVGFMEDAAPLTTTAGHFFEIDPSNPLLNTAQVAEAGASVVIPVAKGATTVFNAGRNIIKGTGNIWRRISRQAPRHKLTSGLDERYIGDMTGQAFEEADEFAKIANSSLSGVRHTPDLIRFTNLTNEIREKQQALRKLSDRRDVRGNPILSVEENNAKIREITELQKQRSELSEGHRLYEYNNVAQGIRTRLPHLSEDQAMKVSEIIQEVVDKELYDGTREGLEKALQFAKSTKQWGELAGRSATGIGSAVALNRLNNFIAEQVEKRMSPNTSDPAEAKTTPASSSSQESSSSSEVSSSSAVPSSSSQASKPKPAAAQTPKRNKKDRPRL